MTYDIISGDGHVDLAWLPDDLFTSRAPAKLKGIAPHVKETEGGGRWFAEDKDLLSMSRGAASALTRRGAQGREASKHIQRMMEVGFYEGGPHPSTPELRIKDQEIDGVDAEVIYGILGVTKLLESHELIAFVLSTYNDWAADFRNSNPDRFVPLACIPNYDPKAAATELRRCAKLGLRGADFAVTTAAKPIWHRDWDQLWAVAAECHIPISFHTFGYPFTPVKDPQMAKDYNLHRRATSISCFQIAGAEFLSAIIFSGAPERFPDFKFVLGECGVGWIPYVLTRMDDAYEDEFYELGYPLKPSDYWRRQGHTTFQHETLVAEFLHLVGEDNVMWGSDYPHPDGIWPDSRKIIEQELGGVDERVRRKVTCENAGKLYGLLS